MSCRKRETVKVIQIDTRYIETDPQSFKAVVQKFTGKDSNIEWPKESSSAGAKTEMILTSDSKLEDVNNIAGDDDQSGRDNNGVSMLSKGMSFKELDRLIFELPSLEELQWSYRIDVE